ncbi:MAG: carbohydrate-binding family 9-like protein [Thermodesulfobacteriota bacterium]
MRCSLVSRGLAALLVAVSALVWTAAWAGDFALLARRSSGDIRIDGRPDEAAWDRAAWTRDFIDLVHGGPPWLDTSAALLWDDDALYLAVRCAEPDVNATMVRRDDPLYRENDVEFFIAGQDAYWEVEANALGAVYDVFWVWVDRLGPGRRYGPPDWDPAGRRVMRLSGIGDHVHPRGERVGFIDADLPGLAAAAAVQGTLNDPGDQDLGWTLEVAIPWAGLAPLADGRSLPPRPGDAWRANFFRFEFRDAEGQPLPLLRPAAWALSPHGVFDAHVPERFGVVRFVE